VWTTRASCVAPAAGGKYVVPSVIEEKFIALCPCTSQLLVFGEGRNVCVALITLDAEATAAWTAARGLTATSYRELIKAAPMRDLIEEHRRAHAVAEGEAGAGRRALSGAPGFLLPVTNSASRAIRWPRKCNCRHIS
jgi:long-subunit acyl-CoA synthetase (AMP-forming)